MTIDNEFRVAVMAGDGIGPEVMAPTLEILETVQQKVGGYVLRFQALEAGAARYRRTGTALPEETLKVAAAADAILLGAMGDPEVRTPDGREIQPQLDLREIFQLYAGVRPIRTFPGLSLPLADARAAKLDFVLVRESTEGLFSSRDGTEFEGDTAARDVLEITRPACERLFAFTFNLARRRKAEGLPGVVTCVDKANVLGAFAFFRKIFLEHAAANPDIETECCYVDAMALRLVKSPWANDVMVTENMFGDILSDAAAGLMGGMGFAPSADIGAEHAVFQPCHGTAPDIAGQGKANPTATIFSAAMMLDWLGERNGLQSCREAGRMLTGAVEAAYATEELHPFETGGKSGLKDIVAGVCDALGN